MYQKVTNEMVGNAAGVAKMRAKALAKDPLVYKKGSAKGGRNSRGYAFAHGKFSPSEAGKIGGKAKQAKRGVK